MTRDRDFPSAFPARVRSARLAPLLRRLLILPTLVLLGGWVQAVSPKDGGGGGRRLRIDGS